MTGINAVTAAIKAFDFEDYGLHEVDPNSEYAEWVPALAAAVAAAARPEVLAEAKIETVAWLVKKAAEQPTWDASVLASKVDRGAVRAFIGTGHYRDALDAYRAEVLREAGGLADELIAAVQRTDPEAFARVDSFRAYSDRLHEIADSGTPAPAGESTQPDFFQPGRTYIDGDGFRAPETLTLFRVETVARHPSRGTLRAIGWAKIGAAPGGTWHGYFLDEGESTGWTEYAEGEVPRG